MIDALLGAFAQAVPDRVPAAGDGGATFVSVGGFDDQAESFVWVEPIFGAWGARPTADGLDGSTPIAANIRNSPVEVIEATYPVRVQEYGYVRDSGGPGKYRGGLAIRRVWTLLEGHAVVQVRSDRKRFLPWGLNGGHAGTPSATHVNPGSAGEDSQPAMFTGRIRAGDTFSHVIAGGGGHGDPLERDPYAVLEDVRTGKLSRDYVAENYGVVVAQSASRAELDDAATEALRTRLREQQGADRHDPRPTKETVNR